MIELLYGVGSIVLIGGIFWGFVISDFFLGSIIIATAIVITVICYGLAKNLKNQEYIMKRLDEIRYRK